MSNRVTCIKKEERYNPYERITHLGGVNAKGANWQITQQQAVEFIESGQYNFHVNQGGRAVNVVVAKSPFGNLYVKTEPDGDEPNNLLNLMECY